ncbi:MAG: malonate-semialdehyde dehydrogenase (acetylating)/methylmalonate-semialdehyde dehydrogenase [Cognaticolwellia sp.]|jgi:malonate-semialdehyde dehydrogenase (acetylating)/methylmalonate-semialdehyde dehydrogenase
MIPTFNARSNDFASYISADNVIGGQVVKPSGSETRDVVNPRHGKAMSTVTFGTAADVDTAVKNAEKAFADWSTWPIRERSQILYKARDIMLRDVEELAWLVSHENGKSYGEAKAEVLKGIECLEYGCSLPNLAANESLEVSRGVNCEMRYEPLGVVAGVTPFNFPFMVPLWMLPQALAGGNAFILKPSEVVPLSALKIAAIFQEAGLPDGILNIVQGGQEVVEALCDHPGIKAFGFVGSTRVAKLVYGRASTAGKRALALGGAKNHLIVVPDADVELTTENVVASFSGCAGQRCMAASVLIAVGEVDHIIEAVAAKTKKMVLGEHMGPVITQAAVERITRYIDEAEKGGATVLVDGRGAVGPTGGYWIGPTLLDHVTADMPAGCEEIFGPVLSILRVDTLEQAFGIENGNPYGNAAAIYTTSGHVAKVAMERTSAGMCGVNIGVPVPREPFGFGGWNDSKFGHGNITGWDGFRFWTRPRKVTSKWALQKDWNWMA